MRRKLISFTGFEGFIKQLREGEVLALYLHNPEPNYRLLKTEAAFGIVATIDATLILGFYAILDPLEQRQRDESANSPIRTTIRRPTEELVFAAISLGIPAVELYFRMQSK